MEEYDPTAPTLEIDGPGVWEAYLIQRREMTGVAGGEGAGAPLVPIRQNPRRLGTTVLSDADPEAMP